MIVIISAMEKEAASLIEDFSERKKLIIAGKEAYQGTLFGKDVLLVISGIGKVSAAIAAQAAIDKYSPEYVLNFGTAGGLCNKASARNFYAVSECCQYDFDLTAIDDVSVGYIQDYDTVFFKIKTDGLDFLPKIKLATADKFTHADEDVVNVTKLGCSVTDMECCAIAQVCISNGVRFYAVKAISDVLGSGIQAEEFASNMETIRAAFPAVIKKVLESVK